MQFAVKTVEHLEVRPGHGLAAGVEACEIDDWADEVQKGIREAHYGSSTKQAQAYPVCLSPVSFSPSIIRSSLPHYFCFTLPRLSRLSANARPGSTTISMPTSLNDSPN